MIERLHIENIALIPKLDINFESKLNVLSGETGAGKSIIIDALNFVLGCRADKTMIRYGQEHCFVEIAFFLKDNEQVFLILDELGIERENTIIINRYYNLDGKNKCQINGRIVALSMLKKLTQMLVDVHGQSEHISLLECENQLDLIDKLGATAVHRENVAEKFQALKLTARQIRELGGDKDERERQIDLYTYQIDEIKAAKLKIGEDSELSEIRSQVLNQEKIMSALNCSLAVIYDDSGNIVEKIKFAINQMMTVSSFDEQISKECERLNSLYYEVKDVADCLYSVSQKYSSGDLDIESIDDRLELVKKLKRKYGNEITDVLQFANDLQKKIDDLINAENIISKLQKQQEVQKRELFDVAVALSKVRKKAAENLENKIKEQLNDLSLKNAQFKVNFLNDCDFSNFLEKMTVNGFDEAEFMFSANMGQPLKPLSKIISGGELSRFMLAIKNIISDIDNIPTLIFDEIDTGISGNVATVVAEKFANISKKHQLIAITHLPQIAAMADKNLLIEKNITDKSTVTKVIELDYEGTLREVARLSGGSADSQSALLHAKEIKEHSDKFKNNL